MECPRHGRIHYECRRRPCPTWSEQQTAASAASRAFMQLFEGDHDGDRLGLIFAAGEPSSVHTSQGGSQLTSPVQRPQPGPEMESDEEEDGVSPH